MIKYLLPAWKNAIGTRVDQEMKKFLETKRPMNEASRAIWYHVYGFIQEEIKEGNMVEEFRDFACAYAREKVDGAINFENTWAQVRKEKESEVKSEG